MFTYFVYVWKSEENLEGSGGLSYLCCPVSGTQIIMLGSSHLYPESYHQGSTFLFVACFFKDGLLLFV